VVVQEEAEKLGLDSSKIDIRLASSYPKPQQTIIVNMDDITHYEIYKVK